MKKHKNKILFGIIILILMAFTFWYGGDSPQTRGWNTDSKKASSVTQINTALSNVNSDALKSEEENSLIKESDSAAEINKNKNSDEVKTSDAQNEFTMVNSSDEVKSQAKSEELDNTDAKQNKTSSLPLPSTNIKEKTQQSGVKNKADVSQKDTESNISPQKTAEDKEYSIANGMTINEDSGKDEYKTEPVPTGKPVPVEPENATVSSKKLTCTLQIRCDTLLNNMDWLDSEKRDIVPKDGIIFAEKTVSFYEGESVFNLLVREMKRNKIHMEFENTPIYNSAYIEGIANIYEFDCGELSGWMYKVNDWFPNYGCSRYQLKAGDRVEWVYTCDLGVDVGGNYSSRNGN